MTTDININKKVISDWIASFKPQYFLTVQFPADLRCDDINKSQKILRQIMKNFERQLLGFRWHKKHIPFFGISEKGRTKANYHFHLYFHNCHFSLEELQQALDKTSSDMKNLNLDKRVFDLKKIYNNDVINYGLKELKLNNNKSKIDTSVLIHSSTIFDLSSKSCHEQRLKQLLSHNIQATDNDIEELKPEPSKKTICVIWTKLLNPTKLKYKKASGYVKQKGKSFLNYLRPYIRDD